MKYLLKIELNDDNKCWGCPCYQPFGYCEAIPNGGIGGAEIIDDIRPSDCPLKPLPINEVDIDQAKQFSQLINDTIDRLLKEDE